MSPRKLTDRPKVRAGVVTAREPRRPLATAAELCEYLGIAINTLYDWRKKAYGPPATKVGNALRFDWDDVEAWQQANKSNVA